MSKNEDYSFFKWLFTRWHFWILSIGWSVWSSSEEIANKNLFSAGLTIIIWTTLMVLIYLIFFQIRKWIKKFISIKVEEKLKESDHN